MRDPLEPKQNAAKDPFQRAKDIRSGKLDDEMPTYDELVGWLMRMPRTWAGGILRAAILQCKHPPFFKDDQSLLNYVRRCVEIANDPYSMLRNPQPGDEPEE